jgi:SAM-dependent methyltransferase
MNHDTIKEFEDLSKEYFNVPGHKKLRQGNKNRLPKYSFVVEKFNKEDNIVDAGCGGSYFKGIFPNLIAFDIVDYNNQDYVCNILDAPIPEDSQDGVFCFGVLHECPDEYHLPNIEKMLTWLKPNGQLVMRCKAKLVTNKHRKERLYERKYNEYFDQGLWSRERIDQFTQQLNLKLNWIIHRETLRKDQQTNVKGTNFDSSHDNDVVFDGHIWSWSKNV